MVDITGVNTNSQINRVVDRSSSKISSASKGKESSSSGASSGDRIEISAGAKEAQVVQRLVSTAQAEPDVRPEAVSAAQQKLESGSYNGVEVSRQAARKILGLD